MIPKELAADMVLDVLWLRQANSLIADESIGNTMEDKILIDLAGLRLTEAEAEKLQEHLRQQVVEFLKTGSEKPQADIVTMGPGWIGIQTG